MEREALSRLAEQFHDLVREHLPGAAVRQIAVLQYGDDPEIEPGELLGRVFIEAPGGPEERRQALHDFHDAHRAAIHELRRELDRIPQAGLLEFVADGGADEKLKDRGPVIRLGRPARDLDTSGLSYTPVMARLGPTDLETVDALITAGIAASRAEAVRWALARIRERPAYAKLRQRASEIEELKAQF
jgi:hypothetical protein